MPKPTTLRSLWTAWAFQLTAFLCSFLFMIPDVERKFFFELLFSTCAVVAATFYFLQLGLRGRRPGGEFPVRPRLWKAGLIGLGSATIILISPYLLGFLVFLLLYLYWAGSAVSIIVFGIKLANLSRMEQRWSETLK